MTLKPPFPTQAPLGSATDRGGEKLLGRSDFNVGTEINVLLRHRVSYDLDLALRTNTKKPLHSTFANVYGGLDGKVGALVPVDERVFRRLCALQGVLANAIHHNAALNPDKNNLASPHAKNVLDGTLLWRYVSLDHALQKDLASAIGTTHHQILDNLLHLDLQTTFL